MSTKEGKNHKSKSYCCSFLQPGLAGYDNETYKILLTDEGIMNFLHTYVGCPVYVHHLGEEECNNKEVGYVSKAFKGADDWYYCDFVVFDKEAQGKLDDEKWLISCAYDIIRTNKGGKHNGIDYDSEVIDGVFDHLAIVPDPRYEDVQVLQNSGDKFMLRPMVLNSIKSIKDMVSNSSKKKEDNSLLNPKLVNPKLINFAEDVEVDGQPVKTADYMNMLNSAYGEYVKNSKNDDDDDDNSKKNKKNCFKKNDDDDDEDHKENRKNRKNDDDDDEDHKENRKNRKNDDDDDEDHKENRKNTKNEIDEKLINSIANAVITKLNNSNKIQNSQDNSWLELAQGYKDYNSDDVNDFLCNDSKAASELGKKLY